MTAGLDRETRVMQVRRGNMQAVFPIKGTAYYNEPAGRLAQMVVQTMLDIMDSAPGRATEPIRRDDTPLALRLPDRDRPLDPSLPLSLQTQGRWEFKDLPVQGQMESTARLPICCFDLIDIERSHVVLSHGGQPA